MGEIATICHVCRKDHETVEIRSFVAVCPICEREKLFECDNDYCSARDKLTSPDCPNGGCLTRERALAAVLRDAFPGDALKRARVHESSAADRGLTIWFLENCPGYVRTGYFPDVGLGEMVGGVRNENLERQSFGDGVFDLVIHLDVLEHLFNPFKALNEIYRTLAEGGKCIFAVPTEWDRLYSVQVAFQRQDHIETFGLPEFHGNPQDVSGSLVTWRYGYDLPLLISRETRFDVEVRRFQSRRVSVLGVMNEIYILSK